MGVSHDTAEFAVESIRQWWRQIGRRHYPGARRILICADGGGSNGSRNHAWKFFLQQLADETELDIVVCHYPPATSKWNKVEHRMFSFISMNWRGKPLVSFETVIQLIGGTRTRTGLRIRPRLDRKEYKKGRKLSKEEECQINIVHEKTLPRWNYTISPSSKKRRSSIRHPKL